MKRCTACFRYGRSNTQYCSHCGRSFNVRICPRGHINPRGVSFCTECGSADLSTPGPPAGFLFYLSDWALKLMIFAGLGIVFLTLALGLIYFIDWSAIAPRLALLAVMLGFLYWTTTLLPGPVKKLGKAAGKAVWKGMTDRKDK